MATPCSSEISVLSKKKNQKNRNQFKHLNMKKKKKPKGIGWGDELEFLGKGLPCPLPINGLRAWGTRLTQ
jgi:hypothetical protein